MNIFATSSNPKVAAQDLCDKHVHKMIVESAQMLANGFSLDRMAQGDCPRNQKGQPRSHGYSKHPCTLWCYETRGNMKWLIEHALEMGRERSYRWKDKPEHFSIAFIRWSKDNVHDSLAPIGKLTDFAIAISEDMNCRKVEGFDQLSAIQKYRLYIQMDKPFAKWTKRKTPKWFKK